MPTPFVSRWASRKKTANTGGGGTAKTDTTPLQTQISVHTRGGGTDKTDTTPLVPSGTPPARDLLQHCPTPACMGVIVQANQFVQARLVGHLAANYAPLFTSAAYQANRDALIVALQAGDLDATKAACRAWCKLVMGWTETQHQQAVAAARRLDGGGVEATTTGGATT